MVKPWVAEVTFRVGGFGVVVGVQQVDDLTQ